MFFPIKEEEPQDQHKDLGCYMMFSIFELICVPGAKAAQLCRSCCGCFWAVWLSGVIFSSTAEDWRQGSVKDLKPLTPLLHTAGISTSSEKQLLGGTPSGHSSSTESFQKSGEDIYYRFPLLRNWGTPGKTSLLYPCQLGFLGRTLQLLDRKILWFIKIYILNQIKLERSSLCLTCGILRLGEPDSSSSNSSKLRNLCLSLNWISGAAQVTFCSLFIKQESSGLHAPCSQILSVIVCNFWLW